MYDDEVSVSGVLSGTRIPTAIDPPFESLVDLLKYRVTQVPHAKAAIVRLDDKKTETYTYLSLYEAALSVGEQLRRAGVKPKDRVVMILPTSGDFLATFFGTLMLGATTVPSAPPYSVGSVQLEAYAETLRALLDDAKPAAVVTVPRLSGLLQGLLSAKEHRAIPFLSPVQDGPPLEKKHYCASTGQDFALLQYTSGSTSDPKGVILTHENILANTGAIVHALQREDKDITISWLPLYHDMGLIGTFLTSIRGRVPVVLIPPQAFIKDPSCWLKAISEHKGTISVAPNFAFGYCASRLKPEDLPGVQLGSLRALLNGAEPVDVKLMERFEEAFAPLGLKRHTVRPVYGLAESSLAVCFHKGGPFVSVRIDADVLERERRVVPATNNNRVAMFVSVGRPIATQHVRIVNDHHRAQPDGVVGEITVKGPSVMKGYYGRNDATSKALKKGWLYTGDYGFMLDGNVFITGRKKDLIIRHGRNYYPQDIEFQVSKIEGVRKGSPVAFAIGDGDDTELVIVAETKADKVAAAARDEMAAKIRERVGHAFAFSPKDVVLVPPGTVPKTTSGKIRRNETKERYQAGKLLEKAKGDWGKMAGVAMRSAMAYLTHWVKR